MTIKRAIPVIICGTGREGDALASLIRGMLNRHPDQSAILLQREPTKNDLLLAHLSIGLHSTDWALVGNSPAALGVRINQMRKAGYIIDAIPDAPPHGSVLRGPSRVTYRLVKAPASA